MAGDRKFYMQKGSTYIEKQVNYIKGDLVMGTGAEVADEPQEVVEQGGRKPTYEEKREAVILSIKALLADDVICKKQDFGAVKRIIEDMSIFDGFTNQMLLDLLGSCNVPAGIMPKMGSLKVLAFNAKLHPEWRVAGVDEAENQRIIEIGSSFKDAYNTFI